ncbi:MAG TPA: VWA domain-containing protein, partial [Armatimonadetes bacterium]|nr:VWA domain-containing protein [Armatimonadota bacterium]
MWGLAFLNQTLALLGITAATIPIIIHLFFRQRFRRMPFTAVIFLRELQSRVARSLRLHDLLLLILRTLAILLVGLALGQPVLRFTHTALHGIGKRTTALILLDNSYSMARLRNNRPLFEHAKRTCRIIINALRRGDSIALWLVNENIEPQQTAPTVELKSVHRSIDEAKLSLLTTDLSSALNEAYRHMRGIKGANREIYLISDMQAIGWQKLLKGKLKIYSTPEVTLFLVDVAGTNTDNAAVLDARPVDSPPLPERQIMLRATLGNYGAARNATVTLLIDGKAVAYERVNLPPNGRTAITFHYRFDKRGMHW